MSEQEFTPMEEDPEYQRWIEDISKDCDCCPQCSDVPCGGVMAGGWCDNACHCEDDLYYDEFGN